MDPIADDGDFLIDTTMRDYSVAECFLGPPKRNEKRKRERKREERKTVSIINPRSSGTLT